jgi:hypothetical protein
MTLITCLTVTSLCLPLGPPQEPAKTTETDAKPSPMVQKIIDVGKSGNKVQEHLDYLTNRIGPRLTGSWKNGASFPWGSNADHLTAAWYRQRS